MKNKVLKSNLLSVFGCFFLLMFTSLQLTKAQDNVIIFDVGSFAVTLLSEGQRQSGPNILIGATEEMVKQAIPNGNYPSATNAFLVTANDKNLLVDAGLGQKTVENLKLCGKNPIDIDAVFITHFHGDHTGSLLLNDVRTYPKATLFVSKPEYDFYMSDEAMNSLPENRRGGFTGARKIFNAYKDKLTIFTPNEIENATELLPGMRSVAAYGHTPGHAGLLIESEGYKLFFWGDLTHAMAIQMPFPEVAVSYDSDPKKAVESRQKLLKYLSDSNIRVAGAHIQYPGIGNIRKNTINGYDFTPLCGCEGKLP